MSNEIKYDETKIKVINYLSGIGGIAFIEFIVIETRKVKILNYENFKKRYEVQ